MTDTRKNKLEIKIELLEKQLTELKAIVDELMQILPSKERRRNKEGKETIKTE